MISNLDEYQPLRAADLVVLAAISLLALAAAAVLTYWSVSYFEPFIGSAPPALLIAVAAALGIPTLVYLQSRHWIHIRSPRNATAGLIVSFLLASIFGAAIVIVDLLVGVGPVWTVPPPQSVLFYPAVAYVVEIVFHVLPMGLLLLLFGGLAGKYRPGNAFGSIAIGVALIEPVFQLYFNLPGLMISFVDVIVGLHIYFINLAQLYIFRRFDFVSMLVFRLVYYLHWHIVWGFLRQAQDLGPIS